MAVKDNFTLGSDPMLQNPAIAEATRFYQLQIQKLEREEEERKADQATKLAKERQRAEAQLVQAKREEADKLLREKMQDFCPHINGATKGVSGQGIGGGRIIAICQICQKIWNSWADVPGHLHPSQEVFGGPKSF